MYIPPSVSPKFPSRFASDLKLLILTSSDRLGPWEFLTLLWDQEPMTHAMGHIWYIISYMKTIKNQLFITGKYTITLILWVIVF